MKNIILGSTSTIHGSGYLEYILNDLKEFFVNTDEILFIPYARPSGLTYDEYTDVAKKAFSKIDVSVKGIHEFKNPTEALKKCKRNFYRRWQYVCIGQSAL